MKTIHTSKANVNSNSENLSLKDNLSDLFGISIAQSISHFDKTELLLPKELSKEQLYRLRQLSHNLAYLELPDSRAYRNFKYLVSASNPSAQFLRVLKVIAPKAIINKLEIAVDCFIQGYGKSDYIALMACIHWPLFRKGNPAKCQMAVSYNPDYDSLTFGKTTAYIGINPIFAGYARISKVNEKPCFHLEFRLNSSNTIAKKTGLNTVDDLIQAIETESLDSLFTRVFSENFTAALTDTRVLSKKIFPKWKGKVDIAACWLHFAREAYNARVMESIGSMNKEDRKSMTLLPLGIAADMSILQREKDRIRHNRNRTSAFQKSLKTVRLYNIVAQTGI